MGLRENIIAYLCGAFAGGCFFCVSQDLHLWLLLNDAYHPRVGLQKMLHITQELVFFLWFLLNVAYYTRLGEVFKNPSNGKIPLRGYSPPTPLSGLRPAKKLAEIS